MVYSIVQSNETNTICMVYIVEAIELLVTVYNGKHILFATSQFSITQRTTVGRTKALSERVGKKMHYNTHHPSIRKKNERITGADPSCGGESMMEMKNSVRIRPGRYDRYT